MTQFSVAITAYNELTPEREHGELLFRAIETLHGHPAVSEIVVVDDASPSGGVTACPGCPKARFLQNTVNLGVFGNKLEAIAQCSGEWVINCDSDNCMSHEFIDRLLQVEPCLDPNVWYCPSFARPEFDYRELIGAWSIREAGDLVDRPMAGCMLNTGNQTVHRETFLEVFGEYRGWRADLEMPNWLGLPEGERQRHRSRLIFDANDSFIFNMYWLASGRTLAVLGGLEYDHTYASGEASNYARAPEEKGALNDILVGELRALSQQHHNTQQVYELEAVTQKTVEKMPEIEAFDLATNRTTEGIGAAAPVMFVANGMADADEPKTVLVVGVPRGGTSSVAAVLDGLGVHMGEPEDMASGGSFENKIFVRGSMADQEYEVSQLNERFDVWGFKNPYGRVTLDMLPSNVRNPCCIFVFRDLVALAQSRLYNTHPRKPYQSFERSANLLAQLMGCLSTVECPSLITSYEAIKSMPVQFVESVVRFLGLEPDATTICGAVGRINTHGGYLQFFKPS
jgi:hypothetical protein